MTLKVFNERDSDFVSGISCTYDLKHKITYPKYDFKDRLYKEVKMALESRTRETKKKPSQGEDGKLGQYILSCTSLIN